MVVYHVLNLKAPYHYTKNVRSCFGSVAIHNPDFCVEVRFYSLTVYIPRINVFHLESAKMVRWSMMEHAPCINAQEPFKLILNRCLDMEHAPCMKTQLHKTLSNLFRTDV